MDKSYSAFTLQSW